MNTDQFAPTPETDAACWMQDWEGYRGEIINSNFARRLERERDKARADLADLQATFDLQHEADMRAIKMWQEANPGNDLTWPDSAKLSVWLMEKTTEKDAAIAELNQRLIDRQESFTAQVVRIKDTWREKLKEKDTHIAGFRVALRSIASEASKIWLATTPVPDIARIEKIAETALITPPPAVVPLDQHHREVMSACSGFIGATEVARRAISAIEKALKKGMAHSRRDLEHMLPRLTEELKQCRLDHQGPVHINSNVRLFDLVRYMRSELHQAKLITDDEFTWLSSLAGLAISPEGGSPSPRRLEDYDGMLDRLASLIDSLSSIARQKLSSELEGEEAEIADFEGAYDSAVKAARDALTDSKASR